MHKKFLNTYKNDHEVMYIEVNLTKNNEHIMGKSLNTG